MLSIWLEVAAHRGEFVRAQNGLREGQVPSWWIWKLKFQLEPVRHADNALDSSQSFTMPTYAGQLLKTKSRLIGVRLAAHRIK